ncbi:MAG: EAL domain-containing protein [Steroidobacteraceae bacterium]|jgi:EAL domain-containing protein (putative c-di-GMP-specific phosphodiesterase class I)
MDQGKHFTATDASLIDYAGVCQRIRTAIEPIRAHAVSLHDNDGDMLWLTESSMGPDEHNAVQQAIESFAKGAGPSALAYDLGDARSAVLFKVTNTKRKMVGAAMLIVESRSIKPGERGASQLLTPKLLRSLADFAALRRRLSPNPGDSQTQPVLVQPADAPSGPKFVGTPPPAPSPSAAKSAAAPVAAKRTPAPVAVKSAPAPSLELEAAPPRNAPAAKTRPPAPPAAPAANPAQSAEREPVSPEVDRLHAALRRSPIALAVQRLIPLTKGSKLKRFEVLLRSSSSSAPNEAPQAMLKAAVEHGLGSMIDRRVVTELIGWLVRHPDVWQDNGSMFSVNLTKTALHDEHFMKFVGLCLEKSSLPQGTVGFEVDVSTAVKCSDRISGVAAGLQRLGCPLVLDDFGMRTECFALLRLPGVKYIKMAPSITANMRTDKISQAAITALVQMARVLGLHTVAKRTETAAEQEWLTALGVDFIQSNALSPPITIESLGKLPSPRRAP